MKRSSKQHKGMDVSTAETPGVQDQPTISNRLDKDGDLSQKVMFEEDDALLTPENLFDEDYLDESDSESDHLYDGSFGDAYEKCCTDEFIPLNQMDESGDALLDDSDEAFIDEVIQSLTKSFELDLEHASDGIVNVRHTLEQNMLKALNISTTTEFFEYLLKSIDQVTPPLKQGKIRPESRPKRKNKARAKQLEVQKNGHQHRRQKLDRNGRPESSLEDPYQPLACILREFRSMFSRYSLRGLDELDALEDTVTLFAELNVDAVIPILTGLTARVVLRPTLEHTGRTISPVFCERMIESTEQAVTTLVESQAVKVLPGVAYSLGQLAIHKGLSVKALPKLLRNSAIRTAASPKLIKLLSSASLGAVTRTSTRQSEIPLRLRVEGPLEIIIRTPLEG